MYNSQKALAGNIIEAFRNYPGSSALNLH